MTTEELKEFARIVNEIRLEILKRTPTPTSKPHVELFTKFVRAVDSGELHLANWVKETEWQGTGPTAMVFSDDHALTLSEKQQKAIEQAANENKIDQSTTKGMDKAYAIAYRKNPKLFKPEMEEAASILLYYKELDKSVNQGGE